MLKSCFQLFLFRFKSLIQQTIPAVFVTAFSMGVMASETSICRDVFSGLPREQKRILDFLSRLDPSLSIEARSFLEVPEAYALPGLKKLYSMLSGVGQKWSVHTDLTEAEASHIRAHVKRGFEIFEKADAYELSIYRRNEMMDITNRVEKLIAEAVAKSILDPGLSNYRDAHATISSALMEHNGLSLASPFGVDSALYNYKLFSHEQISVLLSLNANETGGSRFYGENTRRLKAVGFSTAEASTLVRSVIEQKSLSACCGRGCRSCPKSIGLRRSIQERLSRP